MIWPAAWLDRIDERRAAEDDESKAHEPFQLGLEIAFSGGGPEEISNFAALSASAVLQSSSFFTAAGERDYFSDENAGLLKFKSGIPTEYSQNDQVICRFRRSRGDKSAVVIVPHWNSSFGQYESFLRYLQIFGISAAELCLPFHGPRNDPDRSISDRFLSPNLGQTVRAVQQAVVDTLDVVQWFLDQGYQRVGLIGVSLGSCVAGIAAAHAHSVSSTSLLLTAGDFAEVVWTGRATRHIRRSIEGHLSLDQLQKCWSVISTDSYIRLLAQDQRPLQLLLAERDTVVLPKISERFIESLRDAGATFSSRSLPCGHYTLGVFPYSALAFVNVLLFLRRGGF